ncbi:hypothetical protein PanWU01x14_251680, partial [Parasponia andersonii]
AREEAATHVRPFPPVRLFLSLAPTASLRAVGTPPLNSPTGASSRFRVNVVRGR